MSAELLATGQEFLSLTLRVLPFLLLGALAGAALEVFLSVRWAERLVAGAGARPVLAAVAAGAVLPGCACATMPMAVSVRGGTHARLGTVAAFIFVSPLLSPVTIALTWAVLGWHFTAARVVASLGASVLLGLLINHLEGWFSRGLAPPSSPAPTASDCSAGCSCAQASTTPVENDLGEPRRGIIELTAALWNRTQAILRSIAPYFLLGMLIAAALSTLFPESAIPRLLGGSSGPMAYLLAALVGIPLYVCEGEEVPLTYVLIAQGLGHGPALTFLLGSVGTCVPTVLMARGVIGPRATAFYVAYWFVAAIGAGLLFELAGGAQL